MWSFFAVGADLSLCRVCLVASLAFPLGDTSSVSPPEMWHNQKCPQGAAKLLPVENHHHMKVNIHKKGNVCSLGVLLRSWPQCIPVKLLPGASAAIRIGRSWETAVNQAGYCLDMQNHQFSRAEWWLFQKEPHSHGDPWSMASLTIALDSWWPYNFLVSSGCSNKIRIALELNPIIILKLSPILRFYIQSKYLFEKALGMASNSNSP